MTELWQLPVKVCFGNCEYDLHADYRDILEIFSYLEDPDLPEYLRWRIAIALFYEGEIPEEHWKEAMDYLVFFISCGDHRDTPGPKLLDWDGDAPLILADVNRVAGQEIRSLPFLHWWTFLSWFHSIGEGQLSTVVGIRDKLRRGKKLDDWERDYYRENKHRVDMKKRCSREEIQERLRLQAMLE